MLTVALIMIGAGLLGATVNLALAADSRTWTQWRWNAAAGVGAAFLMPLFLRTISSGLLKNVLVPDPSPEDLFVFSGFCLLAATSSRKFIETLSDRVLRESREAKLDAAEAKRGISDLSANTKQATATALAVTDALNHGIREAPRGESLQEFPEITAGKAGDDPWAGQFGGKAETDGRTLEAQLQPIADRPDWTAVSLSVRSTDPTRPLVGAVQFYLHPSFGNAKPVVQASDGEASFTLLSWGAFTVGALSDDGKVRLELDLSKHPDAKEPWRSR